MSVIHLPTRDMVSLRVERHEQQSQDEEFLHDRSWERDMNITKKNGLGVAWEDYLRVQITFELKLTVNR